MSNGTLTLVPAGGLANRMKAIVAAHCLCQRTGGNLRVVWFKDWALPARFDDLFEPLAQPGLTLKEATALDLALYDRPRRRNLWLPKLPQRLLFQSSIHENDITPLKNRQFDFDAWARGRRCWMSCYQEFGQIDDALYAAMFRPVGLVAQQVERRVSQFSPYTIGMHIRRTDNVRSIAESPTHLFIEAGRRELAAHADLTIFLATDSEQVKAELRHEFGSRLVTAQEAATRSSVAGIQDGLVDMLTLSRTAHIYGSAGSSFSPTAAKIGGCPLTEVHV